MLDNLRPLTQEQRQSARASAREAVVQSIGSRPTRDQFSHQMVSKYPSMVTQLITFLCIILLLAAFAPSAIRLYVIGSLLWTPKTGQEGKRELESRKGRHNHEPETTKL
jgi:hypothetical protein